MGLIFVPYIHEILRKNFQRVSGESTSDNHRGSNSIESRSYQSLEELVRTYDDPRPDTPDADIPDDSGSNLERETEANDSDFNGTERATRVIGNGRSFFLPFRRPQTATPGSTAVSNVDRRTMRLFEVLSAYYVRSAHDRARANDRIPPPPATSSSSPEIPPPSLPSTSRFTGIGLLQNTQSSSSVISRPTVAVPERYYAERAARAINVGRTSSSQANDEESESSSSRPQFILRPDSIELSSEELRLSNARNGPLTFHSSNSSNVVPDGDAARPRLINSGPGLLRAPEQRPGEEYLPSNLRRRTSHLSSASSSNLRDPLSSSNGFLRNNSNTGLDPQSSDNTPQAYLWHNETRTNVTTHGCLRLIMRRYQGWEEQTGRNGFMEYWHYSTVPRAENGSFEVVRDGVARLPWPMLALAGLETLRAFAYQINRIHHRDTPLVEFQGNIFDVILVPFMDSPSSEEDDHPI